VIRSYGYRVWRNWFSWWVVKHVCTLGRQKLVEVWRIWQSWEQVGVLRNGKLRKVNGIALCVCVRRIGAVLDFGKDAVQVRKLSGAVLADMTKPLVGVVMEFVAGCLISVDLSQLCDLGLNFNYLISRKTAFQAFGREKSGVFFGLFEGIFAEVVLVGVALVVEA
jgi:hypothetical protein